MTWRFEASTLDGQPQGAIEGARDRQAAVWLRRMRTGSFRLPLDHGLAELVLSGDALIRAYEDDVLRVHGPVTSAEEVADDTATGSVAVNFADPWVRLTRRLIGKLPSGYTQGTPTALVDRGQIMSDMVAATNAEGESGVSVDFQPSSATYVGPWYYKPVATAIAELAATLDGPDWTIVPQEYQAGKIATLLVRPALGALNRDAVFEYGDGRHNVRSYRRLLTNDGLLTRGYSLPPSFPDNATQQVVSAQDDPAIAARGLWEDVVASDLAVDTLRLNLVQEHVRIRRAARQTITFEPTTRAPRLDTDYALGDVVPFRASVRTATTISKRIDALPRLYGVEFTIDDNSGLATPTITLVNDGGA